MQHNKSTSTTTFTLLLFVISLSTLLLFTLPSTNAQVPTWPHTYQMNQSTIIMPCEYDGFMSPSSLKGWSYIDFDWSNAKQIWAKNKPMNCAELLLKQAEMIHQSSPATSVWVYRNSVKALPWFTSVREKLTNPAYERWFIKFDPKVKPHVPACDTNYNPPLCSTLYHDQDQTPGYPSGDGNCAAPACDVGSVPVGEYIFDPRSFNLSINNQTLGEWFINDYVFDSTGGAVPFISGFFFDDLWNNGGPTEYNQYAVTDMGLSSSEVLTINNAYWNNMDIIYKTVIAKGKFPWQRLYTGQSSNSIQDIASTCPGPLVWQKSCADDLRSHCKGNSPAQNRFMMYAFTPGQCNMDPSVLKELEQDLANFLLIRGKYAVLGHGWLGCGFNYTYPAELSVDYGQPIGLCKEVESGVFRREWTKAVVEMNCNTWTPTITMKREQE